MDLYLDTGVFLGLDDKDTHYEAVEGFLTKHPLKENRFYSANAVKEELNTKRREFTRRGWSKAERRRIFQIIEIFVSQNAVTFTHYDNCESKHPNFDSLYVDFFPIVEKDRFDATILANAFIWSCEVCGLKKPTVVTTDNGHFYKPKKELCQIANKHLNKNIFLNIQCVWDNF